MALHALRIKVTGILQTAAGSAAEDVRGSPLSIHLMETNDVTAGLSQTLGNALSIGMIREAASAVEDNAPETSRGAVLKDELIALNLTETMLTGRLLILEHPGNIHGHTIGVPISRNITRHMQISFSFWSVTIVLQFHFIIKARFVK